MNALWDGLLRRQLASGTPAGAPPPDLQSAGPYRRWTLGVRTLVRLRYLRHREAVLRLCRRRLEYVLPAAEIDRRIAAGVALRDDAGTVRPARAGWTVLFRPWLAYPLAALALAGLVWVSLAHVEHARFRRLFADQLPQYADLRHQFRVVEAQRRLLPTAADPQPLDERRDALDAELTAQRRALLEPFARYPALARDARRLLTLFDDDDADGQRVVEAANTLNRGLYRHGLPFNLNVESYATGCRALAAGPLEQLSGVPDPSACVTRSLLTYRIEAVRAYRHRDDRHPVFFLRRLDRAAITEAVLGRVHIGDDRAQVLLGRVADYASGALQLLRQGRPENRLMPSGMYDVYGLEGIARRLHADTLRRLEAEPLIGLGSVAGRWWQDQRERFAALLTPAQHAGAAGAGGRDGNEPTTLERALERRQAAMIAFHEVQHLIDQKRGMTTPAWLPRTLAPVAAKLPAGDDTFLQHVAYELSAYLVQLAHTDLLAGPALNDLTQIALNPLNQGQPHFYAARILLAVLYDAGAGALTLPPRRADSLAEIARAYKALAQRPDALAGTIERVYPLLFDHPLERIETGRW